MLLGTGDEENRRWSFFSIMGSGVIFRPRLLLMLRLWAFSSLLSTGDGGVGHIKPPEHFGRDRKSSASFTVIEIDSAFMVVGENVALSSPTVTVGADAGDTKKVFPSTMSHSVMEVLAADSGAHLLSGVCGTTLETLFGRLLETKPQLELPGLLGADERWLWLGCELFAFVTKFLLGCFPTSLVPVVFASEQPTLLLRFEGDLLRLRPGLLRENRERGVFRYILSLSAQPVLRPTS